MTFKGVEYSSYSRLLYLFLCNNFSSSSCRIFRKPKGNFQRHSLFGGEDATMWLGPALLAAEAVRSRVCCGIEAILGTLGMSRAVKDFTKVTSHDIFPINQRLQTSRWMTPIQDDAWAANLPFRLSSGQSAEKTCCGNIVTMLWL